MNGGAAPSGWLNRYNTEANTISISEGGNSCGYVQYNTSRYWSGGHCYSLRILHPQETLDLYLYHFLKWQEENIMALRIGSGLPNIQKKDLLRFPVMLPTINKQKGIISILTAIDAKIACEILLTKYCYSKEISTVQIIYINIFCSKYLRCIVRLCITCCSQDNLNDNKLRTCAMSFCSSKSGMRWIVLKKSITEILSSP